MNDNSILVNSEDNFVLAINEKTLPELCLNIGKYADKAAAIFSRVDDYLTELTEVCKSTSINALVNSYNEFRKNYEIIKDNINSYAEDLDELNTKVKAGAKRISLQLYEEANDIKKINTAI